MDTENTVDRFAAESVVRLADYRAPAWRVTHVELKFELGIDETLRPFEADARAGS